MKILLVCKDIGGYARKLADYGDAFLQVIHEAA